MLTEERRQKILEILKQRNSLTITELEKMLSVSGETVRRDLLVLEGKKQLIRVYGGALSINNSIHEKSFDIRQSENVEQKQELIQYALEFINDGDIISIDSGTTAVEFCNLLRKRFSYLTVVTNSLMLLDILKGSNFRLILCAGEYSNNKDGFSGMLTVEAIKKLHIAKAFICPSCISLKHGITDFREEYISIAKAFKESSDKCFVMADSSKFEMAGLYNIMPLTSDITLITDNQLNDEIYKDYIHNDIDIVRGE